MRLDEIIDQIRTGEYDPQISGAEIEFYCLPEDHGINPDPRNPKTVIDTGTRNPTYGTVFTEEETAFIDHPTVKRAMDAGWLLTNPVPTAIRTPEKINKTIPITQTQFEHIEDYKNHRGIDIRHGVNQDQEIWEINTGWVINVPDGYSVFYTHPFNYRNDTFHTLPGVISQNDFPYMFRVPVMITVEEGNIQFNEPLVQIIPFKATQTINAEIIPTDQPAETGHS
jgi:hypothetical protein